MLSFAFLHAHPDDEAIATGGTIAKMVDEGHHVTLIFATRGEVGEVDDGFLPPGKTLGEVREVEAREAAKILGVQRIEFLDYLDSGYENTVVEDPTSQAFCNANPQEAAEKLSKILNDISADILTVYDPNGGYGHPDHIQVHRVGTLAGEIADKNPRVFWSTMNRDHFMRMRENNSKMREIMDEEEENRAIDSIEIDEASFGWPEAEITHFLDISEYLEKKMLSMKIHASQIGDDSFFMKMPKEVQLEALGVEWYVLPGIDPGPTKFKSLLEG